jgi:putative NADPH-quinone reductase
MNQVIDDGIFRFCAMQVIDHHYFGEVPVTTPENRAQMLQKVAQLATGLK